MFHQNIRGLQANFAEFETLLKSHNIDLMTLSETHIINNGFNDIDQLYNVDGYEFIKRNRTTGTGGGVAMYINSGISFKRRFDLENDNLENIWVEVFIKHSKSILISCLYRPPEGSNYLLRNFNELFENNINKASTMHNNKEIIVLGDLNVCYLKHKSNTINKDIKSIFTLYGFKQLITKATRTTQTTKSLIDLITSNQPTYITETDVFPTSISDHMIW